MDRLMPARATSKKGMTVLELLVVIAVLGIFMAIAIPSVTKSFSSMARAKKSTARYPNVRRALGEISDTLRQAYSAAGAGHAFVGNNGSYEAGGLMFPADTLSFQVMDTRYSSIGSVQQISYALELPPPSSNADRGVVQKRSPLGAPEAGIEESLLSEAIALGFRYLDDSQDPPAWVQEWPPKGTASDAADLPAAVEVTVYVLGGISSQPAPFRAVVNLPSQPE